MTVWCYNQLKKHTKKVEFDLISSELAEIDLQLERAEHALNWNSEGDIFVGSFLQVLVTPTSPFLIPANK